MITKMRSEAFEAADVVEFQYHSNKKILEAITEDIRNFNPYSVVSIARGSSDHAAQFMNYMIMEKLGNFLQHYRFQF